MLILVNIVSIILLKQSGLIRTSVTFLSKGPLSARWLVPWKLKLHIIGLSWVTFWAWCHSWRTFKFSNYFTPLCWHDCILSFCVVYLFLSYIWSVVPFLLGWYIQRCCSSYGKFCWWNSSTRFWVGVPEHRRWFGNRLPPHRCSLAYTYGSHQHCKINIFNMFLIHMFAGSYAFLKRAAFLLQCGKLALLRVL